MCIPAASWCARAVVESTLTRDKADQGQVRLRRPAGYDADLYKERNTVERLIDKLKAWRGIATRYDQKPESYLAGPHLRASMIWINDLLQETD